MVAVVAANSATKKLTCNKRRKVLMIPFSPEHRQSLLCSSSHLRDANCSEAQVTDYLCLYDYEPQFGK
jgi:hypothetical protein